MKSKIATFVGATLLSQSLAAQSLFPEPEERPRIIINAEIAPFPDRVERHQESLGHVDLLDPGSEVSVNAGLCDHDDLAARKVILEEIRTLLDRTDVSGAIREAQANPSGCPDIKFRSTTDAKSSITLDA